MDAIRTSKNIVNKIAGEIKLS